MKIGLYFGTFNPIHIGHLIVANHFAENTDLDQIWCVVTPQNPFKAKQSILNNNQRFEMVSRATKGFPKIVPCDIEFNLEQPNYTINTLDCLEKKYTKHKFSLIMGEDNLMSLSDWKDSDSIIERYPIYVYPRKLNSNRVTPELKGKINNIQAPIIEISSSFIRASIKAGKNIRPFLTEAVWNYLDEMNLYK